MGDGIDTIDGGADHDTLQIYGTSVYFEQKGYGGDNGIGVIVEDGAITSIAGCTLANVESVMLDLGERYDTLDYIGTMQAVTVDLATGTATGFTSIAGMEYVFGGEGDDALTGDAGPTNSEAVPATTRSSAGTALTALMAEMPMITLTAGPATTGYSGRHWARYPDRGDRVNQFAGTLSELNGDRITDYESGENIVLEASLAEYGNVRLAPAGADTELQIDGDNDGSFETVIMLTGTISGTVVLSNSGNYYYTNNLIRIVTNVATSGNDLLFGTPVSADVIDGLAGDDEIFGLGGNDTPDWRDGER